MNGPTLRLRVEPSIRSIPAETWDACAKAVPIELDSSSASSNKRERLGKPREASDTTLKKKTAAEKIELSSKAESTPEVDRSNPFITHDFLASLEESGAATARTGWLGRHLLVEDENGSVLAAQPTYLKNHSRGEYVFDQGWAEAFERAGGNYYPKLQVAVPFTPVTGPRLLVRPGPSAETAREALVAANLELVKRERASSLHITFPLESEWKHLTELGLLARTDRQFHWINEGYKTFDDFLGAMSSRKRKMIHRERREACANGVEILRLTGSALTEDAWDAFYAFYMDTGSRKWGVPYLNRTFFSIIGERMRDRIVLVMAKRAGRFVAGALNFLGHHTIYGRYWGTTESRPFLHFEVCYYQAIEYAIEHGLKVVEAGAQGAHKLTRGYRPVTTYSSHYIANPSLRRAVADYLENERAYVAAEAEELSAFMPFRREESDF
jgi:predicted N-acyltransferase